MANNWPAVEQDLQRAIDAAWPEANLTFFAGDLDKMDWEELSRVKGQAGTIQLVAPWAVVYNTDFTEAKYTSSRRYFEGDVTLYYVLRDQDHIDPATGQAQPIEAIQDRLSVMEDTLSAGGFAAMQVLDGGYSHHWGPDNALNRRLSEQKLPMTAGGITFRCLVPGGNA